MPAYFKIKQTILILICVNKNIKMVSTYHLKEYLERASNIFNDD